MAVGEAPEEGAIFRQRSRWCKGHMQACLLPGDYWPSLHCG